MNVVIPGGQSQSGAIPLAVSQETLVGLVMPAAFDGSTITFLGGDSATGTFRPLYNAAGVEIAVMVAAGRFIAIDPNDFVAPPYLKLRSGTSATPVNQTANRTIMVLTERV
jgi:hypothetical protein